jgi:putative transferase (TIGR04331 family)
MKNSKKIFIDKVSKIFDINKDLVLGPWCLKDIYSINKIYEFKKKGLYFENELTNNPEAFKSIEIQHKDLINEISTYIKTINNLDTSLEFCKNLTNFWFINFINIFHFCQRLANLYIKKFADDDIELIKFYKKDSLKFETPYDFVAKVAHDEILLSSLILDLIIMKIPSNWKVTYLNHSYFNNKSKNFTKKNFIQKTKKFFSNILAPRVRDVYGFNLFEKIYLSLILILKNKINKKFTKYNIYSNLKYDPLVPPISNEDLIKLAKIYLPLSLKKIKKDKIKKENKNNQIMLCSPISLFVDSDDQLELNLFKENGGKIISVQHGSSYGDLFFRSDHAEQSYDKFISWGHETHSNFDIKFDPLPSPQLKKMKQDNFGSKVLFVSTSYVFYDVRYGFRDFTDSYMRFKNTENFFDKLNSNIIKNVEFKGSLAGHFSEIETLKKNYSELNIINQVPEKRIKNTKLVVTNNYSTFFFKCLASNIPVILFTKPDTWKLNEKAKKIFEELERNGIIYSDAYLAAEKVNNDFNNIDEWWNKDQIQKSRIKFCKEFAWNDKDYLNYWKNYLWKL